MSTFERYLTAWVALCIVAGVALGHFFAGFFHAVGAAEIARAATPNLTLIPWSQRLASRDSGVALNNQILAYGHCLSNFGPRHRRMAFIDIDEFLVPLARDSLPAALEDLVACPLVVLPWAMFGTSGHESRPAEPTTRAFTQRLDPAAPEGVAGLFNFKCLFDPAAVTRLHVHRMRVNDSPRAWNDRGESFLLSSRTGPQQLSAARIQLNHYYSRSREELEEKIARGGGTYTDRSAHNPARHRARVAHIDAHAIEDTAIQDFITRRDAATGRDFYAELSADLARP